jgi:predicted lipoprotein with Yx(FWY)xxD motif
MKLRFKKNWYLLSLLIITVASSCSKNNAEEPVTPPTVGKKTLKTVNNATFGSVITDGDGRTLYFFSIDANGSSGCSGGCETAWPVFLADDVTNVPGLAAADVATITRADGKKQTTYKGWPLYYFAGDTAPLDVKGDASGGTWFVAKPDYAVMLASTQLVGNDGKNYLENTAVGNGITQYLTDASGRTLYAFSPDKFNLNTYTRADLSNNTIWPIYESDVLNVPSVLSKTMFTQITSVGKKQLTYKGHPLYYFGPDAKRGETKGVSVPSPGAWPILTQSTPALNP